MNLETLNKIYLELSQVATARTARELELLAALQILQSRLEGEHQYALAGICEDAIAKATGAESARSNGSKLSDDSGRGQT